MECPVKLFKDGRQGSPVTASPRTVDLVRSSDGPVGLPACGGQLS
jgi:hypothetical protein